MVNLHRIGVEPVRVSINHLLIASGFDVRVCSPAQIVPVPNIDIPLIENIPVIGDILSGQN